MFHAAEGARDCKHSTHLAQAFLTRSSWPLFIQMYVYMYAYTDAGDCFYVFFVCVIFSQALPVGITTQAENSIFPTQVSYQQFDQPFTLSLSTW